MNKITLLNRTVVDDLPDNLAGLIFNHKSHGVSLVSYTGNGEYVITSINDGILIVGGSAGAMRHHITSTGDFTRLPTGAQFVVTVGNKS